jgi:beta-mannosidase
MFACSDYPDDDPAFVDEVIPELEYQVKRLRNRPCIVYWCGGNEKTGSAGFKISYGERLFHVIARGVCNDLDPTREYRPASPQGHTDLGNDQTSGDSHGGSYEKAFEAGTLVWREKLRAHQGVFNSEFGFHGPTRYESLVRFVPEGEIWPIGESMEYHVQDNPYNPIPETFAQVQAIMARTLVGDIDDAESFVRCASTFHAELLRAEIEHHRRRKWSNAGAMFWMFNDCWPCASWSVVDYYLLPKPAYYAAKRACSPVLLAIIEEARSYDLYLVNDTMKPVSGPLAYGQARLAGGRGVWSKQRRVRVGPNDAALLVSIPKRDVKREKDTHLFARLGPATKPAQVTTFFHRPWREMSWPDPRLEYGVRPSRPTAGEHPSLKGKHYLTRVELKAAAYARMVHVDGVEGLGTVLSDNFFDMLPGTSAVVEIRSERKIRPDQIRIRHWLDRWDG